MSGIPKYEVAMMQNAPKPAPSVLYLSPFIAHAARTAQCGMHSVSWLVRASVRAGVRVGACGNAAGVSRISAKLSSLK